MASENQQKNDMRTSEAEDNEAIKEHVHAQSLKVLKRLPAMGPVIMLYMQSSHRRFQFISDLEWLLLPPLVSGQCKLYMKKEYPISFISWAYLDEDTEKRLFLNGGKLRPEDWKSGENLWIIDIVAPFGGVENMLRDIQKNEFPGQTLKMIAPDPKTGGIKARVLKPLENGSETTPPDTKDSSDSSSSTVQ
jgi:cytolysin-activating lysine-acyltransferase